MQRTGQLTRAARIAQGRAVHGGADWVKLYIVDFEDARRRGGMQHGMIGTSRYRPPEVSLGNVGTCRGTSVLMRRIRRAAMGREGGRVRGGVCSGGSMDGEGAVSCHEQYTGTFRGDSLHSRTHPTRIRAAVEGGNECACQNTRWQCTSITTVPRRPVRRTTAEHSTRDTY